MKEILCWLQTSDGCLFLLTERELHVRDSTTHWELQQQTEPPPEWCYCSLYPYPSLITLVGSFGMKNTHSPFLCKKTRPFCSQAACTCSPSCTVNGLTVQAADPPLNALSWTGLCEAAKSHSESLRPIREARAFSLFIISGFNLGEVFWNSQFYELLPRPD